MGAARIHGAFEALGASDVALGPTVDGGYYLVGVRQKLPALFRDIPWGTRRVWVETLRAASLAHASMDVLPHDFDLDRPADLDRAARMLRRNPHRAPALARILENW